MKDAPSGSPDSVEDALRADHERLDALLVELETSLSGRNPAAAKVLSGLAEGLVYHMSWEDEHLFPAVKAVADDRRRRSVESLEIDHERLRDTLGRIESALASGDFGAAETIVAWLRALLQGHNYDEEHGVYVEADRLLDPAERRRMIELFLSGLPRGSA